MGENDCKTYKGFERRETVVYPCPLHEMFTKGIEKDLEAGEKRMQRFEEKIDNILKLQAQQTLDIVSIKNTIGNGLAKNISDTNVCIKSLESEFAKVCEKYDEKFVEFDEFKWFRTWANGLKNKSISWALTFAILGGLAMSVFLGIFYLVLHMWGKT